MKKYKHLSILLAVGFFITFFLCGCPALFGQADNSKIISGKITSASGDAIAGASVQLKNSSVGTSTNDKGEFSIPIQNEKSILIISNVGYKRQEVAVKNQSSLNIVLEEDNNQLSQVVV